MDSISKLHVPESSLQQVDWSNTKESPCEGMPCLQGGEVSASASCETWRHTIEARQIQISSYHRRK